ncbi:MAG: hypothetical protein AYP45_02245 [Candidatus Brocadia carolinensis]|uniref:Uncharacterized protein n=1 Tax=Candidatus Brocadia carolinensis TaxID=1004156 RepID=A0A1V4AX43_9BACT|nr:MAG: hypothetical protein AYP45_02245 [Candidatus Brocadia caroliniensis]
MLTMQKYRFGYTFCVSSVKGRVEIKGTRTGVPGLIVRVYDVDGTKVRRPLASTSTDQVAFEIHYDDELLLKVRPDGSRPDLLVSVIAPEARTNGNMDPPIFETEVRHSAAREEYFLIHVELEELKKRNILLPHVLDGVAGDPKAAGTAAEMERDRQIKLNEQINAVRKKAVVEARKFEEEADKDLRDRVLQHLTGITPDMPQWKRFVKPGEDVRRIARKNQKDAIDTVINPVAKEGATTFLVLSAEELAALGDPPDAAKVEQLLRQRNPTPSLLREDPTALACLRRRNENPFDPQPVPTPTPTPTPAPTPITNVDDKVSELIQGISIPEDPNGNGGRPDQNTVEGNVKNLKLSKGPADVPAYYDFYNLQIAFDHVWEDARADGVLEEAKMMYRAISDGGGDPKLALTASGDPIRALSKEVELVRQAQERFAAPAAYPRLPPGGAPDKNMHKKNINAKDDLVPDPDLPGHLPTAIDLHTTPLAYPLVEGYPFTLFAENSINFGLLVTYSQRWEPTDYQVGRLVSTQALAPKETISVTMRRVVKTSFNRKQMQANQQIRKEETSDSLRDEAEIVARAEAKTNFALTTGGGYALGPWSASLTTSFSKDKGVSSEETKKSFREAVIKAAQEIRDETKWEQESGETTETENIEKHEISNPNDELALTYIFYELQRRYRVSERLRSVIPVMLVGQHVPGPNEINDDWIRRHDWIIKRFLPDDSFRPALDYLVTREQGDKIVLADLKAHMESLRQNVNDLKQQVLTARHESFGRYAAIENIARMKADVENGDLFFSGFYHSYDELPKESKDALKILDEAAREGYERAVREERDLRARLEREITALQVATDAYIKAQADYTNQRSQIDRLIQHLKSDILRYMQGIWSYEHPDQLFLRHHTIQAPRLESVQRSCTLEELNEWPIGVVPQPGKKCYRVTFTVVVDNDLDSADKNATLAELVDLDHPLGYKGNYIIFPLKKSNALTDYMLTPYLDAELGLRDPDGTGNWTLQEFSDYVQCLRQSLGERFGEVEAELRRQYQELLADPLRDGEEIIVPTKCLYMQMLVDPGKALEEFKEQHRKWDVEKVKAEVLSAQLDNLRRAKLVLEDHLEDPNIESVKNVYYRGNTPPHDGDE